MTKYILAGGCDRQYPDYGKRLAEVIKLEISNPLILSCMFSRAPENREDRYKAYDLWFKEHFGSDVTVLHADEEHFYEQLEQCDVLYLHGGRMANLLNSLPDFTQFRDATANKIIVGSSAGANYLSKVCYSPSQDNFMEGSGWLDVGVVVHYGIQQFEDKNYTKEQWRSAAIGVKKRVGNATTLLIPEGTFTIVEA